ncbi:MAG: CytoChrome c biosis protein [Cyanobacteriota bacterium]
MISFGPQLADWARSSETLLQHSLASPTPTTVGVVFAGGLLTSLGPCSLSLLPVTLAYLAGFGGTPGVKPISALRPASWPPWCCWAWLAAYWAGSTAKSPG